MRIIKKNRSKLFLGLICLQLLFGIDIKAQALQDKHTFNDENTQNFFVEAFTGRLIDTTVYFKFLIEEKHSNTSYVLESSLDGIEFTSIHVKEGFMSPKSIPLLYCYKATINVGEKFYYRIKRTSNNEEVFYSSVLQFENQNSMQLSASNH